MADRNEVRVSDQDQEMLAIKAVSQALAPLDRDTRKRILDWAKDRFLESELRAIDDASFRSIKAQLETIKKKAEELGVTELQIVHAYSAIRSGRVAPIDDNTPEIAEEIRAKEEEMRSHAPAKTGSAQ